MKIVCQVRRDPVEDAYKKRLDSVRQYMISKSIPSELHERVVLYCQFQHRKDQQNAVSQRCSFYVLLCMCERMHSDLTFICAYIMKQHAITTLFEPPSRQCQLQRNCRSLLHCGEAIFRLQAPLLECSGGIVESLARDPRGYCRVQGWISPRALFCLYRHPAFGTPLFSLAVLMSFLSSLFVNFWGQIWIDIGNPALCSLNRTGGWRWSYRFRDPLRRAQSGKSTRVLSVHAGLNIHVIAV